MIEQALLLGCILFVYAGLGSDIVTEVGWEYDQNGQKVKVVTHTETKDNLSTRVRSKFYVAAVAIQTGGGSESSEGVDQWNCEDVEC